MDLYKRHKYFTILNWKRSGLIHDDIDMLYKEYINTFNCNQCHKEFINTRNRHLDHCHETGHKCNVWDSYIKYPNGYTKKDYDKVYNKEHRNYNRIEQNEKARQKVTCVCGKIVSQGNISHHNKTKKHLSHSHALLGL